MKDRHLEHLGDVGAVLRRPGIGGPGREADLVVDDDVNRAAGPVARKLRQVQRLGDESLAGERGVAVDQHRQAVLALDVAEQRLLGARAALDDRIDRFQVARIRSQRDMHVAAARIDAVAGEAQVIFHVAVAGNKSWDVILSEFSEDYVERFPQEISQHIEPATMRHTHANFLHAVADAFVKQGIEDHH